MIKDVGPAWRVSQPRFGNYCDSKRGKLIRNNTINGLNIWPGQSESLMQIYQIKNRPFL
jgi:hypothetical protein